MTPEKGKLMKFTFTITEVVEPKSKFHMFKEDGKGNQRVFKNNPKMMMSFQ